MSRASRAASRSEAAFVDPVHQLTAFQRASTRSVPFIRFIPAAMIHSPVPKVARMGDEGRTMRTRVQRSPRFFLPLAPLSLPLPPSGRKRVGERPTDPSAPGSRSSFNPRKRRRPKGRSSVRGPPSDSLGETVPPFYLTASRR